MIAFVTGGKTERSHRDLNKHIIMMVREGLRCKSSQNCRSRSVFLVLLALHCLGRASASINDNYNVYNYDQAPTFTPDGRLLQVEYASTAAELSPPILALQVDNETLVLMTTKRIASPQNRVIILPNPSNGIRVQPSHICVAMSGMLTDSISLIQVGLKEASKEYQQLHAPISIWKFVTSIANACQGHSFGGGIRPYGSTLLTCGFSCNSKLLLYQTDPSGAILEASSADKSAGPFLRWIVGGTTGLQRRLRKRLDSNLGKLQGKKMPLADILSLMGTIILKETRKENIRGAKSKDEATQTTFEVVVLNRKLGCYRLSRAQVRSIGEGQ